MSQCFQTWLQQKGIRHETSAPHTPEQNGVAERDNRTVVEAARSMLHQKNLPLELWAEAISCAVYTLNRVLSSTASITPFEAWHRAKPDVSNLQVFGSIAFVHIPKIERQKLDNKSIRCVFIGYSNTQKAYRFWDPVSRKVKISRDALFDEQNCIDLQELKTDEDHFIITKEVEHLPTEQADDNPQHSFSDQENFSSSDPIIKQSVSQQLDLEDTPANPEKVPIGPDNRHYPLRIRAPKKGWPDQFSALSSYTEPYEPTSLKDAMSSSDARLWSKAVQEEYDSLMTNGTWTLADLPHGRSTIKSHWIFKVKPDIDGSATRYKARLVAKDYTQRPGIDYADTYSPVVKYDSLRSVLSITAAQDLEMLQLDIKTAFLNGNLEEEIYLEQPEGFIVTGKETKVCRLRKCIYGLKQVSRVWNRTFDDFLLSFGLTRSITDPCIYFSRHQNNFTIVAIWVDDGLVCGSDKKIINDMFTYLSTHFDMRSALVSNFVGLEIQRDRTNRNLYVSQPRYIAKILQKFSMSECNPKKPHAPWAKTFMGYVLIRS